MGATISHLSEDVRGSAELLSAMLKAKLECAETRLEKAASSSRFLPIVDQVAMERGILFNVQAPTSPREEAKESGVVEAPATPREAAKDEKPRGVVESMVREAFGFPWAGAEKALAVAVASTDIADAEGYFIVVDNLALIRVDYYVTMHSLLDADSELTNGLGFVLVKSLVDTQRCNKELLHYEVSKSIGHTELGHARRGLDFLAGHRVGLGRSLRAFARPAFNPAALSTGQEYTLKVINNSERTWDFCVFQKSWVLADGAQTLAWFSKKSHNRGAFVHFSWTIDYSFVWAETGELNHGIIFDAGAPPRDANLETTNQITFNYDDKAYEFTGQTAAPASNEGSLLVEMANNVPSEKASVGVAMSGNGTFAVQAGPNLKALFTPKPSYWLVAGSFEQGEVMDMSVVANDVEIKYQGRFSATATIGADNAWKVTYE